MLILKNKIIINLTNAKINKLNVFRLMSQYNPYFIEPIFRKDQQNDLYETGEIKKIVHLPVKAARNDQTSSLFYDQRIRKFINYVMKGGNKVLAKELVDKTFEKVKRIQLEKYHKSQNDEAKAKIMLDPIQIFYKAVENSRPILTLTPVKRGGATYQVPVPITEKHSLFTAMRWLVEAAKDKDRKIHFPEKLAYELIDAAYNTGRIVKKKQELHKQCEANRAYAHYRWG